MNPELQRIAIAKACGKTVVECPFVPNKINHRDENVYFTFEALNQFRLTYPHAALARQIPDYLNDLNAMHEAEKVLTPQKTDAWANMLCFIVTGKPLIEACYLGTPGHRDGLEAILRCTAAQRAEAFLKTIGKWEESK